MLVLVHGALGDSWDWRLQLEGLSDERTVVAWDAPCGFLRLSPAYDHWLATAAARGWPTASLDAGHFHPLADPGGVAAALLGVLARM